MAHIVRSLYWAIVRDIVGRGWAAVDGNSINDECLGNKNKELQRFYCGAKVCKAANNSGRRNLKHNVKLNVKKKKNFFFS